MPFAQLSFGRMYYEEKGGGTPLVLLHGFSLDHRMWSPQVDFLARRYRVILPDARGHGRSESPSTGYSRADRVNDLVELVDNLGLEAFHLVGLSMGGSTAIGYALRQPERLKSLALVSTGAAGYGVSRKFEKLNQVAREKSVDEARRRWMDWSLAWYKGKLQDVGEFMESMMKEYDGSVWADPMRGKYPREDDLSRVHAVDVPTGVFAGALDKVFAELAEMLHERMPTSRLKIYPEVGHMVNLEIPDEFNSDLLEFLETCEAHS